MTPIEIRAAALKAAQDTISNAKSAERDLSSDERATVEAKFAEVEAQDKIIEGAKDGDALIAKMATMSNSSRDEDGESQAKSLGEHFANEVGSKGLARLKANSGAAVAASPWGKAAGDAHSAGDVFSPWVTDYDRTIVQEFRRPTISDLLGSGSLSGNAVTYLVEGAIEGAFETVAPGGLKPQFHIADPTAKTDALKKIAGFLQFEDEMVEDLPFWVTEINQRGLYMLALAEEAQLFNGDGSGQNVEGLLNRSGVQTETSTGAADNADALFRAMTKIQTATGFSADGIAINPVDYQNLRLTKDGNGQYLGGGFFQGQYGNGGIAEQPPLWGLRTVVSSAVEAGTAAVGAFKVASTVYRKGGVRVESTNSHADDFTHNRFITRIEERIALAVRVPAAIVKVTLSDATGAEG